MRTFWRLLTIVVFFVGLYQFFSWQLLGGSIEDGIRGAGMIALAAVTRVGEIKEDLERWR